MTTTRIDELKDNKSGKNPTKEVIQWVAVNLPEKTLSDVANALDRIQRNDAIQIISKQIPDTVGE